MGGPMDVVAGAKRVIVAMQHTTKDARPKILKKCALPLTGAGLVNTIITELAYIDVTPGGLVLKEIAPGTTAEIVQTLTAPALRIDPNLRWFPV